MNSKKTKLGEFEITKKEIEEGLGSIISLKNSFKIVFEMIGIYFLPTTDIVFEIWFVYDEEKDMMFTELTYGNNSVTDIQFSVERTEINKEKTMNDIYDLACSKLLEDKEGFLELNRLRMLALLRVRFVDDVKKAVEKLTTGGSF